MEFFVLVQSPPKINDCHILSCDIEGFITLVNGDRIAVCVEADGSALIDIITDDMEGAIKYLIDKEIIGEYLVI